MIPVAELDNIARARLEDAKTLLAASRFDGATYLCGYAVEVALKARTAQQADAAAMIQAADELLAVL